MLPYYRRNARIRRQKVALTQRQKDLNRPNLEDKDSTRIKAEIAALQKALEKAY